MGHIINYKVCENTEKAKRQVLAEICQEVEYEDWQEGGAYHGNLTWHDGKVYATRSEAEDAIERFDNGWYSDHAVLFKNPHKVASTKRMDDLKRRVAETKKKKSDLLEQGHVRNKKSGYTGCPKCGSKVANSYVKYGNCCPVCGESLYSETVKSRVAAYDAKIKELESEHAQLWKKQAEKAAGDICWLVKYEYHV